MNKLVDKLFKGIDYFTGILTGFNGVLCIFKCCTSNLF